MPRPRRRHLVEVERLEAVDALQPDVLLGDGELDLLAQDLRVEQVLDADADARRLVGVRRADPAAGRPDLQVAEAPLARAVERDVPRHDQMRVARDEDQAGGRVAAPLEVVELADQHLRIDDAAGADRARLAGDDAARDLADLVRLAGDDDRVPGVRPALVAADEVGRPGRAGRRSCPCPRRPTARRRSRFAGTARSVADASADALLTASPGGSMHGPCGNDRHTIVPSGHTRVRRSPIRSRRGEEAGGPSARPTGGASQHTGATWPAGRTSRAAEARADRRGIDGRHRRSYGGHRSSASASALDPQHVPAGAADGAVVAPSIRKRPSTVAASQLSAPEPCSAHASQTAVNAVARGESQIVCSIIVALPRLRRRPSRSRRRHAAARSANFAYRLRNDSFTVSVGPLRCLATITSASPWCSDSSPL